MSDVRDPVERGWREMEALEAALDGGDIDEREWHRRREALIVPAYLAADNPRAQSGQSGDRGGVEHARGLVVEAIDRDGTFLDVGCASGHLMETVQRRAARVLDRRRGGHVRPGRAQTPPGRGQPPSNPRLTLSPKSARVRRDFVPKP